MQEENNISKRFVRKSVKRYLSKHALISSEQQQFQIWLLKLMIKDHFASTMKIMLKDFLPGALAPLRMLALMSTIRKAQELSDA